MRHALHALTDELRRLKTAGVKTVAVSDESVATLRKAIAAHRSKRACAGPKIENRSAGVTRGWYRDVRQQRARRACGETRRQ